MISKAGSSALSIFVGCSGASTCAGTAKECTCLGNGRTHEAQVIYFVVNDGEYVHICDKTVIGTAPATSAVSIIRASKLIDPISISEDYGHCTSIW